MALLDPSAAGLGCTALPLTGHGGGRAKVSMLGLSLLADIPRFLL